MAWSPDGQPMLTGSAGPHGTGVAHPEGARRPPTKSPTGDPCLDRGVEPNGKRVLTGSLTARRCVRTTRRRRGMPQTGQECLALKGHAGGRQRGVEPRRPAPCSPGAVTTRRRCGTPRRAAGGRSLKGQQELGHGGWPGAPTRARLATGSQDKTARVWDAPDGPGDGSPSRDTRPGPCVAWSPDGQTHAHGRRGQNAGVFAPGQ